MEQREKIRQMKNIYNELFVSFSNQVADLALVDPDDIYEFNYQRVFSDGHLLAELLEKKLFATTQLFHEIVDAPENKEKNSSMEKLFNFLITMSWDLRIFLSDATLHTLLKESTSFLTQEIPLEELAKSIRLHAINLPGKIKNRLLQLLSAYKVEDVTFIQDTSNLPTELVDWVNPYTTSEDPTKYVKVLNA